ncbi:MAG: GNAT family N-acetyltransferase [Pseudomonadota bacterium]
MQPDANYLRSTFTEKGRGFNTTDKEARSVVRMGDEFMLERVSSMEGLRALKQEWQQLENVCPDPYTYFQSYHWCVEWCEKFATFGAKEKSNVPQIYVLRKNAQMVMLWPLMRSQSRTKATLLMPLSTPLSQYSNLLFDPSEFSAATGKQVLSEIKKQCGCDAITLNHLPQSSMISKIVDREGVCDNVDHVAQILDLRGFENWDDYHNDLPRNQRKERNKRRNKIEKAGEIKYEILGASDEGYSALVQQCMEMKRKWLVMTGRNKGILFDPLAADFFKSIPKSGDDFTGSGPLVHSYSIDGEPVAMELGFYRNNHYYSYLGAINLDWQKYSPGKVQIEAAQKWAKSNGFENFDFLGDPSEYKKNWTNFSQPLECRYIPITLVGEVYCRIWKVNINPKLRYFYHNTGSGTRDFITKVMKVLRLESSKKPDGTDD